MNLMRSGIDLVNKHSPNPTKELSRQVDYHKDRASIRRESEKGLTKDEARRDKTRSPYLGIGAWHRSLAVDWAPVPV